jgi:ATP adenylyltransferase
MSGGGCPFCDVPAERVFHDGRLVRGIWDAYPVSPGHALIIPRRHVASWFEASPEEQAELTSAVAMARGSVGLC